MPLHSVPRPPPPHFFLFDFPQGQEAHVATHLLTLPEGMCSTRPLSLLLTHNMTLKSSSLSPQHTDTDADAHTHSIRTLLCHQEPSPADPAAGVLRY